MEAYAVVKTGGKQYTVRTGDVLNVELLKGKSEGDSVELTTLAARAGETLAVGTPELESKVKATVLSAKRGKKILVFKNKRRSTFRKKNGHRQTFHAIRIESIPGAE
ncbi:MAG: 50S ribosomal protein L21 [Acidobacteriota bacterium]|nr:50S ribosomal protein L21 [Acidobacteriota bacterium]